MSGAAEKMLGYTTPGIAATSMVAEDEIKVVFMGVTIVGLCSMSKKGKA